MEVTEQGNRVTRLLKKSKEFSKTLDYRLGLLDANREPAWFRRFASSPTTPFSRGIIEDPVLIKYDIAAIELFKNKIRTSFDKGTVASVFFDSESCLWTHLLTLKCEWHDLNMLAISESNFIDFRKPIEFIRGHHSDYLNNFLSHLQEALTNIEHDLESSFKRLWKKCDELWKRQSLNYIISKNHKEQGTKIPGSPHSKKQVTGKQYSGNYKNQAQNVRDYFQQRRIEQQRTPLYSQSQWAALLYLGFNAPPSIDNLKKRYRRLAKDMHPDHFPDKEDAFKKLVTSYNIVKRLVSSKNKESVI